MAFAVNTAAVATPLASVQAVVVVVLLSAKVPLAAVGGPAGFVGMVKDGALKITNAPPTGTGGVLPSITVTVSGAKGVLTAVV